MDVAAHILGSAAFFMFWGLRPIVCMGHKGGGLASLRWPDRVVGAAHRGHKVG